MISYLSIASLLLSSAARISNGAVTYESEHCPTMKADFVRRQLQEWSSSSPFTIADGGDGEDKAKHVPVLTLSDDLTQFTIVVGNGDEENGVWHPMLASDDPDTVHFISHIYVEDQVRTLYLIFYICLFVTHFILDYFFWIGWERSLHARIEPC